MYSGLVLIQMILPERHKVAEITGPPDAQVLDLLVLFQVGLGRRSKIADVTNMPDILVYVLPV